MRSFPLALYDKLHSVVSAERGASAIEFALIAPVLTIALLGAMDVGRAVAEQMAIGTILRTGAQSAISGGDLSTIEQVLVTARGDAAVSVKVERICACPENVQFAVDCSVTCAGPGATAIYYSLVAEKAFSGMFLPDIQLSRSLQVQVR
ncbi:hypothetical protein GI374_15280 [Paracoccus sp. S-4012]|uniref:TadE/TadG family type IV pilus assembly protein n=1 Tax=Paracoccus sp. S-4012 TaxID=2665648 RepID=UPI0012B12D85|nr:TadE/TadG family type IV pilus assembly protein [Paracoccus sp. S-4012]MRX51762.1 hypothetical protein [Paracoccus sp. S-4012]